MGKGDGALSELMTHEDFEHLETHYRELEKLVGDLRGYHRPRTYSKLDRKPMLENLRRQAEELENSQQRAINAASKYQQT